MSSPSPSSSSSSSLSPPPNTPRILSARLLVFGFDLKTTTKLAPFMRDSFTVNDNSVIQLHWDVKIVGLHPLTREIIEKCDGVLIAFKCDSAASLLNLQKASAECISLIRKYQSHLPTSHQAIVMGVNVNENPSDSEGSRAARHLFGHSFGSLYFDLHPDKKFALSNTRTLNAFISLCLLQQQFPVLFVRALYDYTDTAGLRVFSVGDVFEFEQRVDESWSVGSYLGKRFLFPSNYIEKLSRAVEVGGNTTPLPNSSSALPSSSSSIEVIDDTPKVSSDFEKFGRKAADITKSVTNAIKTKWIQRNSKIGVKEISGPTSAPSTLPPPLPSAPLKGGDSSVTQIHLASTENRVDNTGKEYTAYLMEVITVNSSANRSLWKRYNDFSDLFAAMKRSYPNKAPQFPPFPTKSIFKGQAVKNERMVKLQTFMRHIVLDPEIKHSPTLIDFLSNEKAKSTGGDVKAVTPSTSADGTVSPPTATTTANKSPVPTVPPPPADPPALSSLSDEKSSSPSSSSDSSPPTVPSSLHHCHVICRALFDFESRDESELGFTAGEIVEVYCRTGDWSFGRVRSADQSRAFAFGIAPNDFLQTLEDGEKIPNIENVGRGGGGGVAAAVPSGDSADEKSAPITVSEGKSAVPPSFVINGILNVGDPTKSLSLSTKKIQVKFRGFFLNGEEFATSEKKSPDSSAAVKDGETEGTVWYSLDSKDSSAPPSSSSPSSLLSVISGIKSLFSSHKVCEGDRLIVTIFPQFGIPPSYQSIFPLISPLAVLCFDIQIVSLENQKAEDFTLAEFIGRSASIAAPSIPTAQPNVDLNDPNGFLPPPPEQAHRFTIHQANATGEEEGGEAKKGEKEAEK